MCSGQIGSSRNKIVVVSLLLELFADSAVPYSKSLYNSSTYFGIFASREVSVGWVGRWLQMITSMLTPVLFSMLNTPTRPVSFEGTEILKKPGFFAGVRGLLSFDYGHKHQFEKICPNVLTKGDDYDVHFYRKNPIPAIS